MNMIKLLLTTTIVFISNISFAALYGQETYYERPANLGESSQNLASALFSISNLWLAIGAIAGVAFLFIGIIKFFEHRKNPQQTPFGQVILYLFLAILLLSLWVFLNFGPSGYVYLRELFE